MEAFASPEWIGVEAGTSLSPQAPSLDLSLIRESPFFILDMRQGSKLVSDQANGSFFPSPLRHCFTMARELLVTHENRKPHCPEMGVVLPLTPKTRGLTCDSRQVRVRKRVGRGRVNGRQ